MTDRPDRTKDELFPAVDLQGSAGDIRGRIATGWARTMRATLGDGTGTIGTGVIGFRGRVRMGEDAVEIDDTKELTSSERSVELDVEAYCEVEPYLKAANGQTAAVGRLAVRLDEAR